MEHQVPKRPFRVTDSHRRGRKGIAASSYENIMQQCADRFQFTGPLSLFVEEDGTEIDEDFFELLPSNTLLMVIKAGEDWNPVPQPSTSQSAEPYLNNESQRVTDMVCKIRKAEVGSIKVRSNVYITIILSFKQIDNMHAFDPFAHRDDR
ncbi:lipid transferase CIDEB-like [Mytilus trossulus]|uniref:lipid transferase CIDEB-like n=1 Tax=Mytilus trossulus TaxID=6551 RepID=UPI003005CFED